MKNSDKLKAIIKTLEQNKEEIILPALSEFTADFTERVFVDGKDSKNQKIGKYSERGYIQLLPIEQVNNGKLKALAKKQGRTDNVFVKGGYKETRELTGRQNKYVDLNFTGSLFLSVKISKLGKFYGVGIAGKDEVKKAKDNEKRFNKVIFEATQTEKQKLGQNILKEIKRVLGL